MESARRNSAVSAAGGAKTAEFRRPASILSCTFIRLVYADNQQLILNSQASCRRLLDHLKIAVGSQPEDTVDLMDSDGKLKELNTHYEDYATQYLVPRNTYYLIKIEIDSTTGDKRYIQSFNLDQIDQKIYSILTSALNSLNKSTNKSKRATGVSKQNPSAQLTSGTSQSKVKRQNRK